MIAAIDNTFLTLILNPGSPPRPNPETGRTATHCQARIEALIDDISRKSGTLLVPAPALAEALCAAEAAEAYFEELQSFAVIEVAAFDAKAAFELGRIIRTAIAQGDKRSGESGNWQHVKMDRAIVAIAVAHSATTFYSDDSRQIAFAKLAGLSVKSTWDLGLPADYAQGDLSEHAPASWPRGPGRRGKR